MNLAAVWNELWQGNFAHVWYGITHAHWSNVWGAISAIFTMSAVIVATWAMLRWRKQDELKAKMAFKAAISEYLISVISLDGACKEEQLSDKSIQKVLKTIDNFTVCRHEWWMLEGLLDKDDTIKAAWDVLSENHSKFISGEIDDKIIVNSCSKILAKKFVFI